MGILPDECNLLFVIEFQPFNVRKVCEDRLGLISIAEFLDFAIQTKSAYINKLSPRSRGLLDWTDPGIGSHRGART